MAATVQFVCWTGAGGSETQTNVDTESSGAGVKFSLDESIAAGTTPVQVPTSTGIAFSHHKEGSLYVTAGGGSTSITNRKVYLVSTPTTGLHIYFRDGSTSYLRPETANKPADNTSDTTTPPSGYTEITATTAGGAHSWDNASAAATNSTRNGNFIDICFGVGSNYAGGASPTTTLPSIKAIFDEA